MSAKPLLVHAQVTGTNEVNPNVSVQNVTMTVPASRTADSSDANLSGLALSVGTLSPAFGSDTTSYNISVASIVSSVIITATTSSPHAAVTYRDCRGATLASPSTCGLVPGGDVITVRVTAQDGVTTKDYVLIFSREFADANLSGLALSAGTLSPAFDSFTTSYTASVANTVSSVIVTATRRDPNAVVVVTNAAGACAQNQCNLVVGPNRITVTVTAQDNLVHTKEYVVTVTRAGSNNANLSGLALSAGALTPAFANDTTSYNISVASIVSSVIITATTSSPHAVVTYRNCRGATLASPSTCELVPGGDDITVRVTAQDGVTTKDYVLIFSREFADANLSGLALSAGTLSPAFDSFTTSYTASVANTVSSVIVTATRRDPNAVVVVTNAAGACAQNQCNLVVGPNRITVTVTAQDNLVHTKEYVVVVTRAGDANLSNLALSVGTLTPAFVSTTTSYTASVPNPVSSVTIIGTISDWNATLVFGGCSGIPAVCTLAVGANRITATVTAQDGVTTKTYIVTVTRTASVAADLTGLVLSSGPLSPPFNPATTIYAASVANLVSSVTITPTKGDPNATVAYSGCSGGQPSPSAPFARCTLVVGTNRITTTVTAQDGILKKNYVVVVTRAPSSIANLIDFSLSAGTLTPEFTSSRTSYTTSVAYEVSSVTIVRMSIAPYASATYSGCARATPESPVTCALNVGANRITVTVTAQDGTTTKEYVVVATRAATGSSDANLTGLALSIGTLTPAFVSATTSYTASVANATSSIIVTATRSDVNATVVVSNAAGVCASNRCALAVGTNRITATVTSQDGKTKKEYVVVVTRAATGSSDANLTGLALSIGTLTPAFVSTTMSYTASVPGWLRNVGLEMTRSQSSAVVQVTGPGACIVSLGRLYYTCDSLIGETNLTVTVRAQDGVTAKTYFVTLTRVAAELSNADLSEMALSSGTLTPAFLGGRTVYTASVPNSVTSVTIDLTRVKSSSTVQVTKPNGTCSANASSGDRLSYTCAGLVVGPNRIAVTVTAPDGMTTKEYVVVVTRTEDVSLSGLELRIWTLTPALTPTFVSTTMSYAANVPNSERVVTIYLTRSQLSAVVQVIGQGCFSSSVSHDLSSSGRCEGLVVGSNRITATVKTPDGVTKKEYVVVVTRVAAALSDANLSGLALAGGVLTPAFVSATMSYTASVANSVTSVTINLTRSQSSATVQVTKPNGTCSANTPSGNRLSYTCAGLVVGPNRITATVTAPDGMTTKEYVVVVTRAPSLSNNANLSGLALSSGTLTPAFVSTTMSYTANVANATSSIIVTAMRSDPNASVVVSNTLGVCPQNRCALNIGMNRIVVTVTAQNGVTKKTYVVHVARLQTAGNANLSGLRLSAGVLTPAFSAVTTNYAASVPRAAASVAITPTKSDPNALVTYSGCSGAPPAPSAPSRMCTLIVGSNRITMTVTAQDGVTKKAYVVVVTRAAAKAEEPGELQTSAEVTATATSAVMHTVTATATPTVTMTPTAMVSPTAVMSATAIVTETPTAAVVLTPTVTETPTAAVETATLTATVVLSQTVVETVTPTLTVSVTATLTATVTPTATVGVFEIAVPPSVYLYLPMMLK